MKKIAVFGDSIVEGIGDVMHGGWVNLLNNYVKLNDINISIYNKGISGDTTTNLLSRFLFESKEISPNIIIFAIGINDSQYINSKNNNFKKGVSLENFESNLINLITLAKNFSNNIIFLGLTKVIPNNFPNEWKNEAFYCNKSIEIYNFLIKKLCIKYKLLFLDLFDLLNDNDLFDGLHPNDNGHKKIFLEVKDFLFKNKFI